MTTGYLFTAGRLSPMSLPDQGSEESIDDFILRLGYTVPPFESMAYRCFHRGFNLDLHERTGPDSQHTASHEFLAVMWVGVVYQPRLILLHSLPDLLDFLQTYSGPIASMQGVAHISLMQEVIANLDQIATNIQEK